MCCPLSDSGAFYSVIEYWTALLLKNRKDKCNSSILSKLFLIVSIGVITITSKTLFHCYGLCYTWHSKSLQSNCKHLKIAADAESIFSRSIAAEMVLSYLPQTVLPACI